MQSVQAMHSSAAARQPGLSVNDLMACIGDARSGIHEFEGRAHGLAEAKRDKCGADRRGRDPSRKTLADVLDSVASEADSGRCQATGVAGSRKNQKS